MIAPDDFKESLTAAQAARAIALGWSQSAPGDELELCPLSDGGTGFVDTMHAALGGELLAATVTGPLGTPVPGSILCVGTTAYIESAQACGLHLIPAEQRNPGLTTSFGVGELIGLAIDAGAEQIVVGLGGSGTNDAGAGLLCALGATADSPLDQGGLALRDVREIDLTAARERVAAVSITAASDVDNPLLGSTGATNSFAGQKGASDGQIMFLEGALQAFASVVGRRADGKEPAVALGSGAAGGLGYALFCLGANRAAGIGTVMAAVNFDERVADSDLVITGEGYFDWSSMRGKVVSGVAAAALSTATPCIVVAGQVVVGRREYTAIGVTATYATSEIAGSVDASLADPAGTLTAAAARIARTWSH